MKRKLSVKVKLMIYHFIYVHTITGLGPLLLCIVRSKLRYFRYPIRPSAGFLGTSKWKEALGWALKMLEGLNISSDLIVTQDPLGGTGSTKGGGHLAT